MDALALLPQIVDLYVTMLTDRRPADYLIGRFFKARPDLGHDARGVVAETVYAGLRKHLLAVAFAERAWVQDNLSEPDAAAAAVMLALAPRGDKAREALFRALARVTGGPSERYAALSRFTHEHPSLDFLGDDSAARVATRHSFPVWVAREMLEERPEEEVAKILGGLCSVPPLALRVNTLKATRDEVRAALEKDGAATIDGSLSPFCLVAERRANLFRTASFREGRFEVQDEGSQLIPLLLEPKSGARLLDACAGSGGKTLEMAAMLKGKGEIFAFDTDARRLSNLDRRVRRSGIQNTRVLDQPERVERFAERFTGALDGVLVDAPCTGLGTVRRNPDIKLRVTADLARELERRQGEILDEYAKFVRLRGRLVYATCSILASENERVVEAFLERNPAFALVRADEVLARVAEKHAIARLAEPDLGGEYMRLYPHVHGTDGFFAAVLERS